MRKRGQIEIGIGLVILLGVLTIGSIQSYEVLSNNRFVVDNSTSLIYDLSKCSIENVPKENRFYISGDKIDEAMEKGLRLAECQK